MKTNFAIIAVAASLAATMAVPTQALAGHHHRHRHHNRHHQGAVWGAALGGTTLGFLMGSATAQAARPAQPQVIILQPPPRPGVDDAAYARSAEMMRLKQQNDRLKWELGLLKAQQAKGYAIANNASE